MNITELVQSFGREVRRTRDDVHGLSREELVDRLRNYGLEISRFTLGRIEDGDREPKVREWLALALALNVPPPALLAPIVGENHAIEVTDGFPMYASGLFQWMAGLYPPIGLHGNNYNAADTPGAYRAWLRRRINQDQWTDRVRRVQALEYQQREADNDDGRDFVRPTDEQITAAVKERQAVARPFLHACREARELGLAPVGLSSPLIHDLAEDAGQSLEVDRFMADYGIALWQEGDA